MDNSLREVSRFVGRMAERPACRMVLTGHSRIKVQRGMPLLVLRCVCMAEVARCKLNYYNYDAIGTFESLPEAVAAFAAHRKDRYAGATR